MEAENPGLIEQLLELIEQLVMPNWPDLIALLPIVLIVLIGGYLLYLGYVAWRTAGRTRPRVAPRLAGGEPPAGVHLPGPSRWPFVLPIGGTLILFALLIQPPDEAGGLPLNVPLLLLGLAVTLVGFAGWLLDANREWRATEHSSEAIHGELAPGTHAIAALAAGGDSAVSEAALEPPVGVHLPGPSPWPFFAPLGLTLLLFGIILSPWLLLGGLLLSVIAAAGWYLEASHEYRSTEELGHAVPKTRDPARAWPRRLVPVYVGVAVVSVLLALSPLLFDWLGSLAPAEPGETPVAVPAVPEITARTAVSFETSRLVVPCCRPFELIFHNEQAGVPHDVMISDGPERATVYFDGEIINGPETITYQVPALDEGDYYFLCTVHPNMNGTVEARPETDGPPPSP
jgi:hypothetical protein